ncbi:hypothetical protein MPSEU_000994300 [Mayamaea pseudoterrestris]|nr:hypothetical protein MPSEU_000994300 [Mayamaea pseudoterrestris]
MDCNDGRSDDHEPDDEDDELPFALLETHSSDHMENAENLSNSGSTTDCQQTLPQVATGTQSEGQETKSQSSILGATALFHDNSQFLDAAASLLSANSPFGSGSRQPWSSTTASDRGQPAEFCTSEHETASKSVQFSQLLRRASESYQENIDSSRLAAVPEEQRFFPSSGEIVREFGNGSNSSILGLRAPNINQREHIDGGNYSSPPLLTRQSSSFAETIIPAGPESSIHRSEDRRLASLAGAIGTRTGDGSFTVSVEIASLSCNVHDVIDILSNPEMLPLWCDAVRDVIVTRSSEAALASPRNFSTTRDGEGDREYEGQWIEATSSPLIPPKHTSCVYPTGRSLATFFGFPSYGRVHMFVERQRCQVGITTAPYPGAIEISHKFTVALNPRNDKVRILDSVTLQRDASQGSSIRCCGLWDLLEACLLPSMDDYMDQCLSSMARLRFLAENNGEQMSIYNDHAATEHEWRSAATTPLLAGM